ncbi:MAG: hypothetical protein CL670_13280 [Balneola sp.]|jgi:hypothetical protein|nr:hypothetical protein [Balneola sp.]MBE80122.1 hypothetical protein [Balneola sp.]HBX65909.1 hypothetical protein [Balneolaceae bacterium]|tara:strand:- start:716 stop:1087 length:372 start_codon:yes stop_codon:yes gene_type:complete
MKYLKYLFLIIFLSGCTEGVRTIHPEFGYLYKLNSDFIPPEISNDSLRIPVFYSGCNDNHSFNLQYNTSRLSYSEVWLFKKTPTQFCEAAFSEIISFRIPPEVALTNEIYLLGPKGERILLSR